MRYSGTEPLLRVMLEGQDQAKIRHWGQEIIDAVKARIVRREWTICSRHDPPLSQRQQGRDSSELARRRSSVRARCGRVCVDAGAPGITVHPRADARHITAADVQRGRGAAAAARVAASSSTSKATRARTCWRSCTR